MTTVAVNVRVQDFDVYVGRAVHRAIDPRCRKGSEWGNPYSTQITPTRGRLLEKYEAWLDRKLADDPSAVGRLLELKGKRLGCWCKPKPCHADILVRKIEELAAKETARAD